MCIHPESEIKIKDRRYSDIHAWLKKNYGSAYKCEKANCKKISKIFDWALIKNKKYNYKRQNFRMLCRACHLIYDATENGKMVAAKLAAKLATPRPVIQMTLDGKEIRRFKSTADAERTLKSKTVWWCLEGRQKTCGGFRWKDVPSRES